jgi:hypothetical protein
MSKRVIGSAILSSSALFRWTAKQEADDALLRFLFGDTIEPSCGGCGLRRARWDVALRSPRLALVGRITRWPLTAGLFRTAAFEGH